MDVMQNLGKFFARWIWTFTLVLIFSKTASPAPRRVHLSLPFQQRDWVTRCNEDLLPEITVCNVIGPRICPGSLRVDWATVAQWSSAQNPTGICRSALESAVHVMHKVWLFESLNSADEGRDGKVRPAGDWQKHCSFAAAHRAAEVAGLRGDLRWINNWPQRHPKRMCEKLKQATSLVRCQQPGLLVKQSCVSLQVHTVARMQPRLMWQILKIMKNNKTKWAHWLFWRIGHCKIQINCHMVQSYTRLRSADTSETNQFH